MGQVLLEGEDSPRIVDCNGGDAPELQQSAQESLNHLAAHRGDKMLAVLGNSVVEYRAEAGNSPAWRPQWEKLKVNSRDVRALDYNDRRLYTFEVSDSSRVNIASFQTGTSEGSWSLPRRYHPFVAGGVTPGGQVLLLTQGPTPQLLTWKPSL